jgi:hypothetical protein
MPSNAEIAYNLALKAITTQRTRLDDIRARAGTLLAATSLVTGFLGAEALKDTTTGAAGAQVADRTLQNAEIVGIAAFVATALCCLWILRPPLRAGWYFEISPALLVQDWVDAPAHGDADAMQRELAVEFEAYYDHNEPQLNRLMWWLTAAIVALLVEVVAWLLDLGVV